MTDGGLLFYYYLVLLLLQTGDGVFVLLGTHMSKAGILLDLFTEIFCILCPVSYVLYLLYPVSFILPTDRWRGVCSAGYPHVQGGHRADGRGAGEGGGHGQGYRPQGRPQQEDSHRRPQRVRSARWFFS